jgi:starch-binding outer membrane protein, SusD/RagB family
MKLKHKYLFGLLIIGFTITSCEDDSFLDRRPDSSNTEEQVFSTFNKADEVLTNVYGLACDLEKPINYFFHFSSSGITDECETSNVETNICNEYNEGDWSQTNTLGDNWDEGFNAIREVNVFLQNVKKYNTPDDPVNPGALQRRIGEAYFLRAYIHFLLVKIYGEIPYVTFVAYPGSNNIYLRQQSVHAVGDSVVVDCKRAMKYVNQWNKHTDNDFGRVDQGACLGLIAAMRYVEATPLYNGASDKYHYTGQRVYESDYKYNSKRWELARDAAKTVIDFTVGGVKRFSLYQEHTNTDFGSGMDNKNLNGSLVYARLAKMFLTSEENWSMYENEAAWFVDPTKNGAWTGDIFPPSRGGGSRQQPVQEQVDEYECLAKGSDGNIHGYSIFSDEAKSLDADGSLISTKFSRTAGHKYYDDSDPYVNRDPRFYRDIIYHGAPYRDIKANSSTTNTATGTDMIGATNSTTTGYYLRKFQMEDWKKSGGTNYNITHPIWRLPEFIYIYAEAVNRLSGPNQEIYDLINEVRARSFMASMDPKAITDKQVMQDYIDREWRVEFFYENKEFYRCRLYLKPIQPEELQKESYYNSLDASTAAANYTKNMWTYYPNCQRMINGMEPVQDSNGQIVVKGVHYSMVRFEKESRIFKDSYFLWPISRDEIRRNKGYIQQNPFWATGSGD